MKWKKVDQGGVYPDVAYVFNFGRLFIKEKKNLTFKKVSAL